MAAAAGIAAGGSIIGGILGGKGASKAAKTQLQATREQIAASNANRDYQYNLNSPIINAGNDATGRITAFLNGDANGLNQFRQSTGYNDLLKTGLDAVNANAYARGQGASGAALKALQTKATNIADQSATGYLGNLYNLANLGGQARGLVAGVGTNTVNATNAATQGGADATGNAALIQGSNWAKILSQLGVTAAGQLGQGGTTGSSFSPTISNPDLSWLTPSSPSMGTYRPITGI